MTVQIRFIDPVVGIINKYFIIGFIEDVKDQIRLNNNGFCVWGSGFSWRIGVCFVFSLLFLFLLRMFLYYLITFQINVCT
jgi:hypothetical protein